MGMLKKITPFEAKDLFISWIALAIAFTVGAINLLNLITVGFVAIQPIGLLICFIIALVTVGVSFILHELAHKFTAIKYGFWSEFRKNNSMLVISVALAAILGIVFAAPGATLINTGGRELTKKQNGVISVMGPLVNMILFIIFAVFVIIGVAIGSTLGGSSLHWLIYSAKVPLTFADILIAIGCIGCTINAAIAFFNMLPVGPLDGKKILRWNPIIFIIILAVSVGMIILMYVPEFYLVDLIRSMLGM